MKRIIFVPVIAITFISFAFAQPKPPGDTLYYTFPEAVVVEAFRMHLPYADAPAPVSVIGEAEIQASPSRAVSDLIKTVPGAAVRSYGGQGSIGIVSLRGLDAEYTLVLLNGVRMNNSQIGTVDLDKYALLDIQQVEVVRGGYSSLYGADALGGVISIRTDAQARKPFLGAGTGSFGWRKYEAGSGVSLGATSVSLTGYYEEAENDYSFTLPNSDLGSGTRLRANFVQRGFTLRSFSAMEKSALSVAAILGNTDAGTPGAITGIYQGFARQQDRTALLTSNYQYQFSSGFMMQCTSSFSYALQKYYDFTYVVDFQPLDATYINTQYGATLTADHRLSPSLKAVYGTDIQYTALRSEEVSGLPERFSTGVFVTAEWTVDGGENRLRIIPSARFDYHRDMGRDLNEQRVSPSLAVVYTAVKDLLTLRAKSGMGYRIPTFNQLYWAQGGNPGVDVESSVTAEAGLRFTIPAVAGLSLDAGYFHHSIDNKIIWRPGKGIFWTPVNIRDVQSNGIEAECSYSGAGNRFAVHINGQWISSKQRNEEYPGDMKKGKQLLYVPEFSGSATVHARPFDGTTVSVVGILSGKRYYTATNDKFLESYTTWDISAAQSFVLAGIQTSVKGEILNVFGESYQVTALYPMPGRSFRLSLTTQLQ